MQMVCDNGLIVNMNVYISDYSDNLPSCYMKKLLLVLTACLAAGTSFAQQEIGTSGRFDFRVNAGSTFTVVPDFNNHMLIAPSGMVIPGFIDPSNAVSLSTSEASSTSESRVGWHVEAEGFYKLPRNFSLSFGVGFKTMRFDYTSDVTYLKGMDMLVFENIDNINRRFGETALSYISITPCNISKEFLHSRLSIQAGPVLNWLLKEKSTNTALVYFTQEAITANKPDQAYFDTIGNTRKMIWGANFSASYKVLEPVYIKVSAQYYVNSMYEDTAAYGLDVEKINPLVLQAGLSVAPFAF
jgi:hypothetical protein